MKKWMMLMCVVIVLLSGCARGASGPFDYPALLELLEANDFSFIDVQSSLWYFSVLPNIVAIGDERLTVYAYESNEAMEIEAGYVDESGYSIYYPEYNADMEMRWPSTPYWSKRDLVIVFYRGEDERILDFLKENLELFAGG